MRNLKINNTPSASNEINNEKIAVSDAAPNDLNPPATPHTVASSPIPSLPAPNVVSPHATPLETPASHQCACLTIPQAANLHGDTKAVEEKKTTNVTFSSAARNGIVVVEVGSECVRPAHDNLVEPISEKYSVHKNLLERESEYFRAILNEEGKEAEEKVIKLEKTEPVIFGILVDWLYTGRLLRTSKAWAARYPGNPWIPPKTGDLKGLDLNHIIYQAHLKCLLETLIFSRQILAPNFQRAVHNVFVRQSLDFRFLSGESTRRQIPPSYEIVILAFEYLPSNSPILRLLVDTQCCFMDPDKDRKSDSERALQAQLPHDFLVRLMMRCGEMRKALLPRPLGMAAEGYEWKEAGDMKDKRVKLEKKEGVHEVLPDLFLLLVLITFFVFIFVFVV